MALRSKLFQVLRRNVHVSSWELPVTPGGTLKVRLPTTASIKVRPLNPHQYDWTQARIDLHILPHSDSHLTSEEAQQIAQEANLSVISASEPGRSYVLVESPEDTVPTAVARTLHGIRKWIGGPIRSSSSHFDARIVIDAQIPGKFDLDMEVQHGSVEVEDTFEGDVKVHVSSADVNIEKIKGMYVDIETIDGDVSTGVIQGNFSVRTCEGNVDVRKAQGPSVKITTNSGDIQARALYADFASLRTAEGTVRLGGANGYTKVRTGEGNVEVCGIDGRLDIETDSGDVEASVSVPKTVTVRSKTGDIAMGLPSQLDASLLFEGGESVTIDDDVPFQRNEGGEENVVRGVVGNVKDLDACIHARAPAGEVIVRRQVWGGGAIAGQELFPRWATGG